MCSTSAFAVLAHPRAFHSSSAGTDKSPLPAPDQGQFDQFDINPDAPGFSGASVPENPPCFDSTQHIVVVWKAEVSRAWSTIPRPALQQVQAAVGLSAQCPEHMWGSDPPHWCHISSLTCHPPAWELCHISSRTGVLLP